jgi:uncharacterized protein (TIGR03067 family)
MNRAFLVSCVAVLAVATVNRLVADQPPVGNDSRWEFKAVAFTSDPTEATRLLNDLNAAGWEYVGPLANGLVAFRRPLLAAADVAAKREIDRLQGTWTTVTTELDGQQRAEVKKEKITFAGSKWTIKSDGEVTQEGTVKILDIGGRFVQADFLVTEGYKQGDTWMSIYQIDGDKLKWCGCYVSESKVRPKALSTRDSDGYFLRTLKRDK